MTTTPVESWAVDLTSLGPVYPFVGYEVLMVCLCVAFWIGWHVIQLIGEGGQDRRQHEAMRDPKRLKEAMTLTEKE